MKELNVKIDASDEEVYAGLFGNAQLGTLRNLGVSLAKEGISATGKKVIAGGLAGSAEHIRNCFVTGDGGVVAQGSITSSAGGIVGVLADSLTHCYATVGVKATGMGTNHAGGIAAQSIPSTNILAYTYATGTVEASGGSENIAGGICGQTGGTLSNSLALNATIAGDDGKSYRIAGNRGTTGKLFSNFASTKISLSASAADSLPTADRINGADTWLETLQKDLIPDDQDPANGWNAAWEWTQGATSKSTQTNLSELPKLKITEGENDNPNYIATSFMGQPDIDAKSVFSDPESSPLILGAHIAEGDSVYLAYDNSMWLRNVQGSDTPTLPFNGEVKGYGCPVFILTANSSSAPTSTSTLTFDGVNLELDEACLTANNQDSLTLQVKNNVTLANKKGGPAIVNAGKLTITAANAGASLSVLSPDSAIRNTGTLTLNSTEIHLVGGASTIFNKESGILLANNPAVEWQFASSLRDKVLEWESSRFSLPQYATGRSFATTSVPDGTAFGLKAGPSGGSSAPATQKGRAANGDYTTAFTAPAGLLTVYTDVKDSLPPPPPPPVAIYYTVALPAVEGAATKPGAGNYTVEEGYHFRFFLTLDSDYNLSKPVVTTDRGETITPRTSDGAYIVRNVYEDIQVFISGIVKNGSSVANETIQSSSGPQIWAKGNTLYIQIADEVAAAQPDVRILTATGHLYTAFKSVRGLTYRQLPAGLYIVQVGKTVRKVIIR